VRSLYKTHKRSEKRPLILVFLCKKSSNDSTKIVSFIEHVEIVAGVIGVYLMQQELGRFLYRNRIRIKSLQLRDDLPTMDL
jgi:hypothetical protein